MPNFSSIFTEGLDSDTEKRLIPPGRYPDAVNCVMGTSDTDTVGAVKNEPGNLLRSIVLPAGTNTCIKAVENRQDKSIIYFIHNSNNDHTIVEYFVETQIIEFVLMPIPASSFDTAFLNFDVNVPITHANIYNGNLTWVNGEQNPPRHLRIVDAKAAIAGTPPSRDIFPYPFLVGLGTDEFREQFISYIKYAPTQDPSFTYLSDAGRKTNYIRTKLWQFAYRYVYYDFSRSAFSPWSEISNPQDEETSLGLVADSDINNGLQITVNTGHPNVRGIEIMYREGNTGAWFLIDDPILKYDIDNQRLIGDYIDVTYNWYGDQQGVAVPPEEADPLFDAVPLFAYTQEWTHVDRQFFGDYVFGYDNVPLDVEMDYRYVPFDIGIVSQAWDLDAPGGAAAAGPEYFVLDRPAANATQLCLPVSINDVVEGTRINVAIVNAGGASVDDFNRVFSYIVKAADLASLNALATAIAADLNTLGATVANASFTAAVVVPGRTCVEITLTGAGYATVEFQDLLVGTPQNKRSAPKKGAWHDYGIVYSDDQGRVGAVNASSQSSIYVPFHTEEVPGIKYEDNVNWDVQLDMTIKHLPPPWATSYQIVYAGSNIDFFLQWDLNFTYYEAQKDVTGVFETDRIYFFVPDLVEAIADPKRASIQYTWEKGDRIRFITQRSDTEVVLSELLDLEVVGFDGDYLIVENFDAANYNIGFGSLFEIYRPSPEVKSEIYQEISERFPIVNGYHQGNVANQSAFSDAVVRMDRGDVYLYGRDLDLWIYEQIAGTPVTLEKDYLAPLQWNIESQHYSDFYESDDYDNGRTNAVVQNAVQERYGNSFIYGGRYFPGTQTNDAFKFNLDNANEVGVDYGNITALSQVGFTLKVLQERKLNSVYINRRMTLNSAGQEDLVLTDAIVADIIPSNEEYGCQHPQSVVRNDRHLYWYDARKSVILRDSPNGTIPVSDYFQAAQLLQLTNAIVQSAGNVISSVDNYFDRILFTFKYGGGFTTLSFHEPSNRWKSRHDYNPEAYGFNGNVLVSFVDGELWEHNVNPIACSFYGTKFRQSVKSVVNQDPISVKNFLSLAINSNKPWEAPNVGDLSVPANDMYPNGMSSRFYEAQLAYREGVYYLAMPRDANTPNAQTQDLAIINGRQMRGQVMEIDLSNEHDEEVVLLDVECNYNKSERTV